MTTRGCFHPARDLTRLGPKRHLHSRGISSKGSLSSKTESCRDVFFPAGFASFQRLVLIFLFLASIHLASIPMSTICSVAVLAATNYDPYVAFSTVTCLLEYQSPRVRLKKCNTAVTDLLVIMSCRRLASRNVVVVTDFPRGSGVSLGISSRTLP